MNNKPALMNNISDFFNDKSKWKWSNLNILLVNNKNFKSEKCDSDFFNNDFLNFRFLDTVDSRNFLSLLCRADENYNYYINDYSYNPNPLYNNYINGSFSMSRNTELYYQVSSSYNNYGNGMWSSYNSSLAPISFNPLQGFEYELIKYGFENFLKRIISENFELKIDDSYSRNEPKMFDMRLPDGTMHHFKVDKYELGIINYATFADTIKNFGQDFISLFHIYSNLLFNYRENIVIKSDDMYPFIEGFEEAIMLKDSMPTKNKVLLVLNKTKDSSFFLGNFKDFIYRINNKNEIIKCKLKEKV